MHEWASDQHGFWSFLWALAFVFLRVSARSQASSFHAPKIGQKPAKTKFLQNICAYVKMTNNYAGVRTVSDFDIEFMPLSRINKG